MLAEYVKQLQISLRISNESQATMLNGMHEGLLILDAKKLEKGESEDQALFCNWPAQKVLTTFIGPAGSDQDDLMGKLCFEPIKGNAHTSFLTRSEESKGQEKKISLQMIITLQKDEPNQRSCIYKLKT